MGWGLNKEKLKRNWEEAKTFGTVARGNTPAGWGDLFGRPFAPSDEPPAQPPPLDLAAILQQIQYQPQAPTIVQQIQYQQQAQAMTQPSPYQPQGPDLQTIQLLLAEMNLRNRLALWREVRRQAP
jgi:hypothetical protein